MNDIKFVFMIVLWVKYYMFFLFKFWINLDKFVMNLFIYFN